MNIVSPTARIVNEQAFRLGALSAQLQELCCPEMTFVFIHDKRDFCAGWASINGDNDTTRFFLEGTR